ncbi:hypothetical protein O6H91_05G008800 [Diphasiastrum complanatum]|uniref:Uncharacterized protein n=2 Tax=Diphasiastrum complanatum TaxID=34168 RepID=A0ACC2DKL7_DIPCM|nr:hypothetical protein O6H91_05G008800 [Diphasiastrum complanatum]KAJ7554779.1 hypothetical protein O6H91_05G008800 [Diphasiastrum complanatum]
MDRKNWPWRKKSSDKNTSAPDPSDTSPSHSSKLSEEQEILEVTADTGLPQDLTDSQLAEEQIRNLNEKLLAAASEISAKDLVVKQHVKVAEEAVSGWEKAETETASIKQKLELSQQEKLALEDRASHLDGALKECMRQLRLVREEQEDAIHEALVRKTRDSDKLRLEMEAKLADMSQQLIESAAEKSAFEKALQERAKSISELGDAKSRAESEVQVLQVRVDLLEKENSGLKYELHLSNKEVEIRNEEREYARKAAEASQKQHLENVKKITKLETECQRLRVLVKKKLPGPAALTQMRIEVEALGKDSVERKKKLLGKVGGPPRSTPLDPLEEGSQTGSNDSEVLSEKLVAMEEEIKMLKEALESRTNELQEARLMCTKTASKLSKVEQQLDALSNTKVVPVSTLTANVAHLESTSRKNKTPSLASVSVESCNGIDANHADIWASALIAELENFRKDKVKETPDKPLKAANLDLMDDFIEMERLASTMSPPKPVKETLDSAQTDLHLRLTSSDDHLEHELSVLRQTLETRDGELQSAHQLALELTSKLTTAEEQLNVLRSKNSANERIMLHLQERIKSFIINQAEDEDSDYMLKEGKVVAINDEAEKQSPAEPVPNELILRSEGSSRSSQLHVQPPCASSEESGSEADASTSVSDCDTKAKLTTAVCKLIHLVEIVAQRIGFEHVVPGMKWSHPTVEKNICKLVCFGNSYLEGKVDSSEFIAEISSVLDCILGLGLSRSAEGLLTNVCPAKKLPQSDGLLESIRFQVVALASVTSEDCKVEDIEETRNVLIPVASQAGRSDSLSFSSLDNEKVLLHSDKANHDSEMMAEFTRGSRLHEDLAKLKIEKAETEQKLEIANKRIECLRIQVSDAEQLVLNIRLQLASTHELKQLAEDRLETVACSKSQLESEVKVADVEINQLQERVATLNMELEEERQQHQDAKARLRHLWQQLSEGVSSGEILAELSLEGNENPSCSSNDENQPRKEREIAEAAEKLAQCQRTILALGKQLKALASPTVADSVDSPASAKIHASIELLCSSDKEMQAVVEDTRGETQRYSTHEKHPESSSSLPEDLKLGTILSCRSEKMDKGTENFGRNGLVPCDLHLERSVPMSSSNLPRPSSPGRSPLKFKPSKNRILNATADLSKSLNAADSPPSEKLSNSGFARFFSRTKSSHG